MTFLEVVIAEFKAFFSNVSVLFVVFIGSILYVFLYPTPYYADVVRKQKIVVVDLDNTPLSKDFIFLVNASNNLEVSFVVQSEQQAKELLERSEVYGQLSIPNGFEKSINNGTPVELLYRANASYFLIYGAIIEGLNEVGNYFSSQLKKKRNALLGNIGVNSDEVLVKYIPIPLFNPSVGYINYALAAILVFILHQTLLAGVMILSATHNKEYKNGKQGYFYIAPLFYAISARIFVFSMIYVVLFLIYFGVFFKIYGINVTANSFEFWCFGLMFIVGCASLGVFLGTFMTNIALPTQLILLSSLPLVFMMGFIYPIMLLPVPLQLFVKIIPAYHGINGFIRLNQMSDSLYAIMPHFYALFGIFIVSFSLSYYRYYKLRKNK
ncbi:ABC transporter permease [Helicobacter didelphidarum]|uniref:ABC transporter permease n=1 Tax=Helicobacter didelphidarum TaxID=2040648 RepID=A0A3D8IED1_9HELI|nr:ABC transporter permease [Helicobacter didelphidarum]RDU63460.1 ABC transporter permease [Helicobacter didelphidarum]